MFFTIISFYKQSENQDLINENITLGSYLDNLKLSEYFIKFHIIPMVFGSSFILDRTRRRRETAGAFCLSHVTVVLTIDLL